MRPPRTGATGHQGSPTTQHKEASVLFAEPAHPYDDPDQPPQWAWRYGYFELLYTPGIKTLSLSRGPKYSIRGPKHSCRRCHGSGYLPRHITPDRAADTATPCPTCPAYRVLFEDGDAGVRERRREPIGKELAAGVSFLRSHPVLRSLTILLSVFSFLTLGLNDLIIYHLKHDLEQGDGAVGTVFAVGALGTVAGALFVAPIRHRLGFGVTWTGGVAVCGLALAAVGSAGSVAGIAALTAVFLGCVSVSGTCSMSLRQEVTPDHLLGRVTSAFWTIHYSAAPIGAAVLTWAAQRYGTGPVCFLAGVCCLLVAVLALFTPVRARRPEQAGTAAAGPVPSGPGQEPARSGSCRDD
ncbi:MFS transporter [Streptomyces sp. NPDC005877]|uniref:MFS transporter n=1 Tax=Streptomyces sp. NPDC005877 TaxID=3155346 RepID=UPI0033D8CA59